MKTKYLSFLFLIFVISISFSAIAFGARPLYAVGDYSGYDAKGNGVVEVSEVIKINPDSTEIMPTDIILKLRGWWIEDRILSCGNKIYFLACKNKNNKKSNFRLYEYDVKTKKYKYLHKLSSKYKEGELVEVYNNSVYMYMKYGKNDTFNCLRYNINSGKLKMIFKSPGYYRYKDVLVGRERRKGSEFLGAKYNKEFYVYNAKTGKKKSIFKGYAEGLTRIGRYLYYAVAIDDEFFSVNDPSLYKIMRYDLATGKKKTLLKSGKFLEISFITDRYVYHGTWYWAQDEYYRYDLKLKKNRKITTETNQKAMEALMDDPNSEDHLS